MSYPFCFLSQKQRLQLKINKHLHKSPKPRDGDCYRGGMGWVDLDLGPKDNECGSHKDTDANKQGCPRFFALGYNRHWHVPCQQRCFES